MWCFLDLTLVNDLSHKSTKQTRRERCGDGGYDCGAGLKHGDLMSDADAMAALLKVSAAVAPTPRCAGWRWGWQPSFEAETL